MRINAQKAGVITGFELRGSKTSGLFMSARGTEDGRSSASQLLLHLLGLPVGKREPCDGWESLPEEAVPIVPSQVLSHRKHVIPL